MKVLNYQRTQMYSFDGLTLWLQLSLTFTGFGLILLITKIYKPYKTFQSDRTLMKPFLLVGLSFSIAGLTEIIQPYIAWGEILHSAIMLISAVFLVYAVYNYRKELERLDVITYAKTVSKLTQEQKNDSS